MTHIKTDFCIVGGGPAGATLALLLVRSGMRVVVIDRSSSLDRDYRGEILQPGGMRLLSQLGVLDAARQRGCHEHDGFQLVDRGRVLIDADYRRLPGPFNHLLSIPQRNILEEILAQCRQYHGFTYLGASKVQRLARADDAVVGVVSSGRGGMHVVDAHCVVGADGRYSKVRRLAGIGDGRLDVFNQDVLWLKFSAGTGIPKNVRISRAAGNPVLVYASVPNHVQIGWTLPHRGYRAVAERGVEYVKEQITTAIPDYAEQVSAEISSLNDLTLLDVFAGCAPEWVQDGLVLIGDSAHTHSPIGAQGINLAIQDAVALHPVLVASRRANDASAAFLGQYEAARRPDIDRIMRLQIMQSKAMLSAGPVASFVRPKMAALVSRTPIYRKVLRQLAFGNEGINVAENLLGEPGDYLVGR